ncbi:MAG: carbohydrate kinase family protein [Acidobacteriaceae bacterium]|nr:carbohydrate kinase family protein [Acidobacteriaceae bacterium]MBV9780603.1 carbohydrate kinase family protein [Acidobacteriaceae bacterium]
MTSLAKPSGFDVLGIGLNATDTLLLLPEFPSYAGKIAYGQELLSPGGQVATAIVACVKLGLRAKYIGTIGDDIRGNVQRQSLEATGVDISDLIVRRECPNQTAYILIDQRTGERTVLWHRADCLRLAPSDIKPEAIRSAKLLHIDGYDVDAASHAASLARQQGIPVSLDVDTVYPGFDRVLENVDYLVASSSWPKKWTGEEDPFIALPRLQREYGLRIAAMTLGDRGSLAFERGSWAYSPAFEVSCADTTGAGDVFHGAFCCAMLHQMPLQKALDFSNAAAALNCTAIGARGKIPARAEVDALIARASGHQIGRRHAPAISSRFGAKLAQTASPHG